MVWILFRNVFEVDSAIRLNTLCGGSLDLYVMWWRCFTAIAVVIKTELSLRDLSIFNAVIQMRF